MNYPKKQSALVSVLLNGEPFLFVLLMFCGFWLSAFFSEQIGQIIPFWVVTGFSILLSSAVLTLIYPKPNWWLAFIRYLGTGILTGVLVTFIVSDLVKHESFLKLIVNAGLTQIWEIVKGVEFPASIIVGMLALFLSMFWIIMVVGFFVFILMIFVALLFGMMNTILLIWFKPIFDSFEAKVEKDVSKTSLIQQSGKSKWLALIFCIVGFVFFVHGIHRIYTGRYITGIVQLLTLGGFFIWSFSDIFLILSGNFVVDKKVENTDTIDSQFIG